MKKETLIETYENICKIEGLLAEAGKLFERMPAEIQQTIFDYHNEHATIQHCLRYGLQAVKEIREVWHTVVADVPSGHGNTENQESCRMTEKYVSERLLNEMPRPLINFLWYLWEMYCNPVAGDIIFVLRSGDNGQQVTMPLIGKTVEQEFGASIDSTILIRKEGSKYFMSRK